MIRSFIRLARSRRRGTLSLLLAASLVTELLCLTGCKRKPRGAAQAAPTVEVTTVTQADVPIYHEWIGVLDGLVNAHIRAQVPGYLLYVADGLGGQRGRQPLIELVPGQPALSEVLAQSKGLLNDGGRLQK